MSVKMDGLEAIGLKETASAQETDLGFGNVVCWDLDAAKYASCIDEAPKYVTFTFDFESRR
jgi:hypothetical protein